MDMMCEFQSIVGQIEKNFMGNVIVKPLARTDTPDDPRYATDVDGVRCHGGEPMTPEGREAIRAIIAATSSRPWTAYDPRSHKDSCGYQCEQYSFECNCGVFARPPKEI